MLRQQVAGDFGQPAKQRNSSVAVEGILTQALMRQGLCKKQFFNWQKISSSKPALARVVCQERARTWPGPTAVGIQTPAWTAGGSSALRLKLPLPFSKEVVFCAAFGRAWYEPWLRLSS